MKRIYDAIVWKTGHSWVVTIPKPTLKKLKLKKGSNVKITLEK